jgi:hypothetical protein
VQQKLQAASQSLNRFLVTPDPADAQATETALKQAAPALSDTIDQIDPGPLRDQGEKARQSLSAFRDGVTQVVGMTAALTRDTQHVFGEAGLASDGQEVRDYVARAASIVAFSASRLVCDAIALQAPTKTAAARSQPL